MTSNEQTVSLPLAYHWYLKLRCLFNVRRRCSTGSVVDAHFLIVFITI